MGIVRTRTILVRSSGHQTHQAVLHALAAEKLEIRDHANPIRAKSAFALMKNRWAAELTIEILEDRMVWRIDALGDKHDQILDGLLARLPRGMVDDQGIEEAVARLSQSSRWIGSAEIRRLATVLTSTEHVVALAVGTFDQKLGALVLTTERIVFFEQGWKSQDLEEFNIDAIQSLGVSKRMTGESIDIAISGRRAEIASIRHGEGEDFVAAFREVRDLRAAATVPLAPGPLSPGPDAFDQLRRLGELHQAGILTEQEFASKKAEILDRM